MSYPLSYLNVELSSSDEISSSSSSESICDNNNNKAFLTTDDSLHKSEIESDTSSVKTIFRELLSPPRIPPDLRLTLLDDLNSHCAFVPYQIIEDNVQIQIPVSECQDKSKTKKACCNLFLSCFDSIIRYIVSLIQRIRNRRRSSSSIYDSEQYSYFLYEDPNFHTDIESGNNLLSSYENCRRFDDSVGRKRSVSSPPYKNFY